MATPRGLPQQTVSLAAQARTSNVQLVMAPSASTASTQCSSVRIRPSLNSSVSDDLRSGRSPYSSSPTHANGGQRRAASPPMPASVGGVLHQTPFEAQRGGNRSPATSQISLATPRQQRPSLVLVGSATKLPTGALRRTTAPVTVLSAEGPSGVCSNKGYRSSATASTAGRHSSAPLSPSKVAGFAEEQPIEQTTSRPNVVRPAATSDSRSVEGSAHERSRRSARKSEAGGGFSSEAQPASPNATKSTGLADDLGLGPTQESLPPWRGQDVIGIAASQLNTSVSIASTVEMTMSPLSNLPMSPLSSSGRGDCTLNSSVRRMPGPIKDDPYKGILLVPLNDRPFASLAAIARNARTSAIAKNSPR